MVLTMTRKLPLRGYGADMFAMVVYKPDYAYKGPRLAFDAVVGLLVQGVKRRVPVWIEWS